MLDKKYDAAIDTLNLLLKICGNKPILWVDNIHARAHSALMICYVEKSNAGLCLLIEGNHTRQVKFAHDAGISSQILDHYLDLWLRLKNYNFKDTIVEQKPSLYASILNNNPIDAHIIGVINSKFVSLMDQKNYQIAIVEMPANITSEPTNPTIQLDVMMS